MLLSRAGTGQGVVVTCSTAAKKEMKEEAKEEDLVHRTGCSLHQG